jgi:hypothetical protein
VGHRTPGAPRLAYPIEPYGKSGRAAPFSSLVLARLALALVPSLLGDPEGEPGLLAAWFTPRFTLLRFTLWRFTLRFRVNRQRRTRPPLRPIVGPRVKRPGAGFAGRDQLAIEPSSRPRRIASVCRLHAARVAFAKVRHDRELFEAAGIGPGDAYMALWSHLIELRNSWQSTKTPETRGIYRREYVDVLKALLPYERPRLQVVKVKTDQDAIREPEEMAKALARIT